MKRKAYLRSDNRLGREPGYVEVEPYPEEDLPEQSAWKILPEGDVVLDQFLSFEEKDPTITAKQLRMASVFLEAFEKLGVTCLSGLRAKGYDWTNDWNREDLRVPLGDAFVQEFLQIGVYMTVQRNRVSISIEDLEEKDAEKIAGPVSALCRAFAKIAKKRETEEGLRWFNRNFKEPIDEESSGEDTIVVETPGKIVIETGKSPVSQEKSPLTKLAESLGKTVSELTPQDLEEWERQQNGG